MNDKQGKVMFTLLLKRKAMKAKKASAAQKESQQSQPILASTPENITDNKPRLALEDKPWDAVQHALKMDLEYVRTLAGSAEKNPYKQTLIDKYKVVVSRLVDKTDDLAGLDIVWWYYQWSIDCGLLNDVHDAFKALVLKGLNTPQSWSSNGQTAYCDIIFKYSNESNQMAKAFNTDYLIALSQDLIAGRLATNAAVKVKVFKLVGDLLLEAGQLAGALDHFNLVMAIDPSGGGRKTKIKALQDTLNNASQTP